MDTSCGETLNLCEKFTSYNKTIFCPKHCLSVIHNHCSYELCDETANLRNMRCPKHYNEEK